MSRKGGELDIAKATPDQMALIRRFLVAFNAIEAHLKSRLRPENNTPFNVMVSDYQQRFPAWRLGAAFREFAVVRNGLIHNETSLDRYLYVPLSQVVKEIERQKKAFLRGEPVLPRFDRNVHIVEFRARVTEALVIMCTEEYSQLPVYDDGQFKGLLTENGVTRWLGHLVTKQGESLDLSHVTVREALREDEKRREVEFVPGDQEMVEVASRFITNPLLEAVLLTKSGQRTERLLGIITAWDIARWA